MTKDKIISFCDSVTQREMITTKSSRFINHEEIREAHKLLSAIHGGNKESYFGVVYISKKFNIPLSDAAAFVACGQTTNEGIDGYYHDNNTKTLHLFVFRWSEDHLEFKGALDRLGNLGINKIFFDPTKSDHDHPMIISLKTHLFQNWRSIDRVAIDFIFNGDPVDAEQSKVLSFLRESIEDKRGFVESCLSRMTEPESTHDIVFHYISNVHDFGDVSSSRGSAEFLIPISESLMMPQSLQQSDSGIGSDAQNTDQMTVAFLSLGDLYRMYSALGERFFEKNLRSGLGDGTMTNAHIRNSIKNILTGEANPLSFSLFHNGVTLTAQILDINRSNYTMRMVEPRILNGAQTVMILKQFIDQELKKKYNSKSAKKTSKKRKNDEASTSETDSSNNKNENEFQTILTLQQKLADIKVLARIIRTADEGLLKKITISNNRQNPIMPWNLRANDVLQISYEELFARLGIYYERRENSYRSSVEEDIEGVIDAEKGVVEIKKFAQTLLALQGKLDRISKTKEVFESEAWYKDVFKEHYLELDPKVLVFLYKLQFRLQSVSREIKNIGAEKYGYASKARNLVWCLCIQGLLNDSKFDRYVEMYGTSTTVEAGITEMVKKLATGKIRFILGETFESKKYANLISGGKYSFLTSNSTLNECLKTAHAKFGWHKKSL